MDKQDLQLLIAYNCWSNEKVLGVVSKISGEDFKKKLETGFNPVRETLIHIFECEAGWLKICRGISDNNNINIENNSESLESIKRKWFDLNENFQKYVEALTDEDSKRKISYQNDAGKSYEDALEHLIQHLVNHSTYHRGQIMTHLRQIKAETVNTDFLSFIDEYSQSKN